VRVFRSKDSESGNWTEVGKLFIIIAAVMAVRNSYGVFFTSIENQFQLSRGATSAIFSVFMGMAAFFTILGGWALDRFGPKAVLTIMGVLTTLGLLLSGQVKESWQLFLTYSFLLSAGTGGGFSLVLATVSRLFVIRRGLALGIALSGEGVGTLVIAPIATFLISSFNWRTAFTLIGISAGVVMICFAQSLRKVPRHTEITAQAKSTGSPGSNTGQTPGFSLKEAVKTGSFWFLGSVYLLLSFSFYLVLAHMVPHAIDMGITAARAAIIISLVGASTIPGRLIIGWASDKTSRKRLAISSAIIQTAAMIWLACSGSLWMLYVFAICFGFTFGALSNLMATLIGDTFGMTNLGSITGVLVVGFTLGAAIGPALGGFVFDATNSYFASFMVGIAAAALAVVCLALTKRESVKSLKPRV
jgi:MFS transporter, OFA family, oxalate/formate antiporter